ncbi:MAG: PAS domain S-box protein [Myxococcales bacterium]|nr:PAS domain S-box protein [Myxococcales bacterium]
MTEGMFATYERLLLEVHRGFVESCGEGFSQLAKHCTQLDDVDFCAVYVQNTRQQCYSLEGLSRDSSKEGCLIPQHILSMERTGALPWVTPPIPSESKELPLDISNLLKTCGLQDYVLLWVGEKQPYGFLLVGSIHKAKLSAQCIQQASEIAKHVETYFARHFLEQEDQETNELFSQTQELTQSGLWRLCLPSGRVFWSEEVYRIHGLNSRYYQPDLLHNLDFYPEESRVLLEKALKECTEHGTPFDLELDFLTAQKKRLWVRARGARTLFEGDEIHITGTFQDINAQKTAQETLRQNEERFRAYFEQGSMGIAITAADGTLVDANPYICRITGYTQEEMQGMHWMKLIKPQAHERAKAIVREVFEDRSAHFSRKIPLQTKTGEICWAQSEIVCLHDNIKGADYVLAYIVDLTEQQKLEAERLLLEEQMQHATHLESLSVLAGGIAHDFNNLLVGITGNASLALLELPENAPARSAVEKIEHASQRAADLTRQMLAYAGHGRIFNESISLSDLVLEMSRLLSSSISKKAQLLFDIYDQSAPIFADRTQIQQIVMNLLINASDALEERIGTVKIRVGTEFIDPAKLPNTVLCSPSPPGDFTYLEVKDSGCGMSPEVLKHVFEPFFTTKEKGHGLGLAAVIGIMRAHNGYLTLASQRGQGTTFRVGFPAIQQTKTSSPYQSSTQIPRRVGLQGVALVADDEHLVRDVVQRMLEHQGFQVHIANDGLEALTLFQKHKNNIDILLLDLNMPGLSGKEVLQKIRQEDKHLPILLMSGFHEAGANLEKSRHTAFMAKPFRGVELFDKLKGLLGEEFQFFQRKEHTQELGSRRQHPLEN